MISLYFRLNHVNNTDPAINGLYYESTGYNYYPFSAFAYRTGPGVYDIYVQKGGEWDYIDVWSFVSPFMAYRCYVTYATGHRTTVPSGAVMAKVAPMTQETPTVTKTSGSSTASGPRVFRDGNTCTFECFFTLTANVTAGSDIFVGKVTNFSPPVVQSFGFGWNGQTIQAIWLDTDGTLTVRNFLGTLVSNSVARVKMVYQTNQ